MPEPWDDVAFLRMCSLTEPAWGPWEYEDGPATLIDARDTTVCVFVARPEPAARVAAWCLGVCLALAAAGGVWEWLR